MSAGRKTYPSRRFSVCAGPPQKKIARFEDDALVVDSKVAKIPESSRESRSKPSTTTMCPPTGNVIKMRPPFSKAECKFSQVEAKKLPPRRMTIVDPPTQKSNVMECGVRSLKENSASRVLKKLHCRRNTIDVRPLRENVRKVPERALPRVKNAAGDDEPGLGKENGRKSRAAMNQQIEVKSPATTDNQPTPSNQRTPDAMKKPMNPPKAAKTIKRARKNLIEEDMSVCSIEVSEAPSSSYLLQMLVSSIAFKPLKTGGVTISCLKRCCFQRTFPNGTRMRLVMEEHFSSRHRSENLWNGFCCQCSKYIFKGSGRSAEKNFTLTNELEHLIDAHTSPVSQLTQAV